ncbi:MAG TPA: hypothetical protein V6D00_07415 [Pantanalinema sp.]
MAQPLNQKFTLAFERVDRDWLGGAYAALALAIVGLAEAIRLCDRGKVQTGLLLSLACVVGFGIWYILRVPDSIVALFRSLGALLGHRG